MHSFWQRLNAIFFFTLSCLGFLSFLGAGMTYWHVSDPRIELSLEKIVLRKIYGAGHDQAVLTLGIDADLRSVFNWNVKQLFVYVTAEYETEANVLNQVVVWDTIINDSPSVRAPAEVTPGLSCPYGGVTTSRLPSVRVPRLCSRRSPGV